MVKPDRELYEPPYDDALMYDTVEEPQGPRGRPLIVLLGIVVLAAFAGVVWVAYNQGVKEGQRGVNPPILSAQTGPTRIVPETPAPAPESGPDKSMERLSGDAAPPSEAQIMSPPEEPRPLPSPQDVATIPPASPATMTAPPRPAAITPTTPSRPDAEHPGLDTTVSPVAPLPQAAHRIVNSQATHTAPPSGSEDLTTALPPATDAIAAPPATPKPAKPKPVKPAASAVPALPTPPEPVTSTSTEPDGEGGPLVTSRPTETQTASLEAGQTPSVTSGGPIAIQLGSFPTDVLAASSWGKIKSANAEVLGAYTPKFHRAEVEGKGTWYRLQVTGFSDKASAQDVCNKLKANGQACIITSAK